MLPLHHLLLPLPRGLRQELHPVHLRHHPADHQDLYLHLLRRPLLADHLAQCQQRLLLLLHPRQQHLVVPLLRLQHHHRPHPLRQAEAPPLHLLEHHHHRLVHHRLLLPHRLLRLQDRRQFHLQLQPGQRLYRLLPQRDHRPPHPQHQRGRLQQLLRHRRLLLRERPWLLQPNLRQLHQPHPPRHRRVRQLHQLHRPHLLRERQQHQHHLLRLPEQLPHRHLELQRRLQAGHRLLLQWLPLPEQLLPSMEPVHPQLIVVQLLVPRLLPLQQTVQKAAGSHHHRQHQARSHSHLLRHFHRLAPSKEAVAWPECTQAASPVAARSIGAQLGDLWRLILERSIGLQARYTKSATYVGSFVQTICHLPSAIIHFASNADVSRLASGSRVTSNSLFEQSGTTFAVLLYASTLSYVVAIRSRCTLTQAVAR